MSRYDYEEVVKSKLENFPMLYQHEVQCMNHLFLVIGNGYEWYHGRLRYFADIPRKFRYPETQRDADTLLRRTYRLSPVRFKLLKVILSSFKLDDDWNGWYGIYDCSCIAEMPERVATDWLNAAIKCALYVLANPKLSMKYMYQHYPEPLDTEQFKLISFHLAFIAKHWSKVVEEYMK